MDKAVIYIRVSTTKQKTEWNSLQSQEKICKTFCKEKGYKAIEVFEDDYTWTKSERPWLNELYDFIKNNPDIKYCIIKHIDRSTRDEDVYREMKKKLRGLWVELKDVFWIIQWKIKVSQSKCDYDFLYSEPSKITETMTVFAAEEERKQILRRTILKEEELEEKWYQVRASNYWYENKRIPVSFWKATIQIKKPIEWDCVIEMYQKRAEGYMSDKEIVEELNLKGYRKRTWKKLTVKYLQEVIRKPVYAGIISSKWTWKLPIRTPYKGLVSIDLWNKANRWKIEIIEIDKTEVKIEYNNGKEKQINKPIKEKRKDYNPDYPFAKVLKCPICWGAFTWNASKGWNGNLYPYYQCRWKGWEKHTTHTIKLPEVHKTLQGIFWNIIITEPSLLAYEEISQEVFQELQKELEINTKTFDEQIRELNKKEQEIVDNVDKYLNLEHILKIKNEELDTIKADRIKLEVKKKEWKKNTNLERFLYYSKEVITHIDKLALQSEEPELINLAFDVVFDGRIEFNKIQSHTLSNLDFFSLQSQQKNPSEEEFSLNSKWQFH